MNDDAPPPAAGRKLWLLLAAPALLGLALRIAAADGAYWLDEAWSAVHARDAGTAGRAFFAINHDNNHYLNTLWLQLIGWDADPLAGRAFSILCGTAAIVVAGLIGARRGMLAAGLTAGLFAISPILVTYGAEARGYAPMLLALLAAIWIVDRRLYGVPLRWSDEALGIAALSGMLAQLSMLFGIGALAIWIGTTLARRKPWPQAMIGTGRLMIRPAGAAGAVLLLVLAGALASPTGFRMGSLSPFTAPAFVDALAHMLAFTLGIPSGIGPWLVLLVGLLVPFALWRTPSIRDRAPFHLAAILGLPLAVALLRPDNSAFPRYYLLGAVALLLLVADLLAAAVRAGGRRRAIAGIALAALIAGSVILDTTIIRNQRGDPGLAIAEIAARSPAGTVLLLDNMRDSAVIEAAAAARGYRLQVVGDSCAPRADFLFFERNGTAPFPSRPVRCATTFHPIAAGRVAGLSGMDWQLYGRMR